MTGQGNKQYEQIRKSKASADTIDVSKKYRTASGHTVRNLQVVKTNKAVIGRSVVATAIYHNIITGEVCYENKWYAAEWKANGQHVKPEHSLVEIEDSTVQGSLF
jgi:hypothetical protein